MKHSASFFCNMDCAYFPCHDGVERESFNCLFCYCPLYSRSDCGGRFTLTADGVKDCSACTVPHRAENYEYVLSKLRER